MFIFLLSQLKRPPPRLLVTNIPLCFAIVDYEKAYDSIEFEPFFKGLKNQGVDDAYLNIPLNLYSEATSVLRLHKDNEKFKLGRGARQGDNISPKLLVISAIFHYQRDQLRKQRCQDWRLILIAPYCCRWYSPHSQLHLKATGNAPRYPWHQQASRP